MLCGRFIESYVTMLRRSRILVVDDDPDILDLLKYNFEKEGFKVKTLIKSKNAVKVAHKFFPDLIILDIMMPNTNGIEVCKQLRCIPSFQNTHIFFLSAKSGYTFQDEAMRVGGDDYIEKLTGLRLLLHKVNSVLKRHIKIQKGVLEISIDELTISRQDKVVYYRNSKVYLNSTEFEILFFLAQNPTLEISVESIIQNIWGSETPIDISVEFYIETLRRKITPGTIRSVGNKKYKFGF